MDDDGDTRELEMDLTKERQTASNNPINVIFMLPTGSKGRI